MCALQYDDNEVNCVGARLMRYLGRALQSRYASSEVLVAMLRVCALGGGVGSCGGEGGGSDTSRPMVWKAVVMSE